MSWERKGADGTWRPEPEETIREGIRETLHELEGTETSDEERVERILILVRQRLRHGRDA